ncbi:MAG: hypothetical protein Q9160_008120 [Pyrenula sp. 1 TL-2023]
MPWKVRTELAESFCKGCEDIENENRGHDAFNIAAFYAIGYGVQLSQSLCFKYLRLASSCGYVPAVVLDTIFCISGLPMPDHRSESGIFQQEILRMLTEILEPLEQNLRFPYALRSYYKYRNSITASERLRPADDALSFQGERSLREYVDSLDLGQLHEIWINVDMVQDEPPKLLLHHLIIAHEELAESVLSRGANAYLVTAKGITLLHIACACGSLRITKLLLELAPELAQNCSKDGVSPLHWLFMFEQSDIPHIAETLVRHGASTERVGVAFLPEFHLVLSGPPLHWAIMTRNLSAVRSLVELGVDVNIESPMPRDCLQYSGFAIDVATCMLLPEIVEFLISVGAEINERPGSDGMLPFHRIGDTVDPFRLWLYHGPLLKDSTQETINILLRNGANIDGFLDAGDLSPLEWIVARVTCFTSVLEQFLHSNPQCPDRLVFAAAIALQHDPLNTYKIELLLGYCSWNLSEETFIADCNAALEKCTKDGTVGAISKILPSLKEPAKDVVNANELVHLAASYDHVEMLRFFADQGADLNLDIGGTPAATAACYSKINALRFLLLHGSTVLSLPSEASSNTLLHEIVSNTTSEYESEKTLEFICQEFLHKFLSVVDSYEDNGFTALHLSIIWGTEKNVARLLEDLKAKPLSVKNTEITPTSLAALAIEHPPWLILQQGDSGARSYQRKIRNILRYLIDTVKIEMPRFVDDHQKVSKYWTTRSESQWRKEDQIAEWYMTQQYSDTGLERKYQ